MSGRAEAFGKCRSVKYLRANVSIELWEVSGYRKYENTWPAIRHTGIGIIFVYDGDKSSEELEKLVKQEYLAGDKAYWNRHNFCV